jgi:hypothetical protein
LLAIARAGEWLQRSHVLWTDAIRSSRVTYGASTSKFETVGLMPQAIGVMGETGGGEVDKVSNCEPAQD